MIRTILAVCTSVAALAAVPSYAAVFVYSGSFSGAQEVPPVNSPGIGTVIAMYDDVAQTLRIETTFARLIGNTTMAHIHCCAGFGANAGVATTVPSLAGFPLGVTFGSSDTTLDLTAASSFNPAFVTNNGGTIPSARAALVAGLNTNRTYFNIHTSAFPGGEIRAQLIAAVPEPATWGLMILGFGAIGAAMRARRTRVTFA